jgi:hypothetical protein
MAATVAAASGSRAARQARSNTSTPLAACSAMLMT